MGDLERAAVAGTLSADVALLHSAFGNRTPAIRVYLAGQPRNGHRWLAAAVYLLAAATELESVGFDWCVVADRDAGTVALEMVRHDEETVEAAMRVLRTVVASTPLEGVRCA